MNVVKYKFPFHRRLLSNRLRYFGKSYPVYQFLEMISHSPMQFSNFRNQQRWGRVHVGRTQKDSLTKSTQKLLKDLQELIKQIVLKTQV